MKLPGFTLDKIKFATDGPTFEKAVALYESGKVTQVEEGIRSSIFQSNNEHEHGTEAA